MTRFGPHCLDEVAVGVLATVASRCFSSICRAPFRSRTIERRLRSRVEREVALTAGRAAARLGQLLDSGSKRVDLDAAKFSLGVAGIKPAADAQVNVNLELRAGYVISLEERDEPAAKIVGGEAKVIDAKPTE